MKERKFTEEECVKNGGHFWKYWTANDSIDENFNKRSFRYAVYYPDGEPQSRGCPLCGRVEHHISYWATKEELDNEKHS